jgi:hypothetical protein
MMPSSQLRDLRRGGLRIKGREQGRPLIRNESPAPRQAAEIRSIPAERVPVGRMEQIGSRR